MLIRQLAAKQNLELAWRRITTGGNQQYKRFFRSLYYAYEVALDDNLNDLRQRLLGGAFKPSSPERVYVPKGSGLHRPLTLLHLEDQIVLQAFANLSARRLFKKRKSLQLKVVFSNILQDEKSIFFFRRWQETYSAFQKKITKHYKAGLRWVADFDLAAFYDTISHRLLLQTVFPRTSIDAEMAWLLECLWIWSSERESSSHGHGLPQGPIASDFLAECFLLPVDLALQGADGYTRYVDDIRLFGRTEEDVRRAVIRLERHFRERGLIPQSGKFAIKKVTSIRDAMGKLPSLAEPQQSAGQGLLPPARARKLLMPAIGGKPQKVIEKTRFRFILFRADPDPHLLSLVLRLMRHHPEHADVFFAYIARFGFRKPILGRCLDLVDNNPYPYLRGEAWHILATYVLIKGRIPVAIRNDLALKAIEIAKSRKGEYFMERLGACHFLAASEVAGVVHLSRFLKYQTPLLQSLLADMLPDSALARGEAAEQFLHRSTCEPGLALCGRIHGLGLTPQMLGVRQQDLPSQVCNTLRRLGVIQPAKAPIDPIGEILQTRYGVPRAKSWHQLLGVEYVHALGLLRQAEATFYSGLSFWLICQNSFNHAIFLALQKHLKGIGDPGTVTTLDRNGYLVDFGVMLDRNGKFTRYYPAIADCLRAMNERRNHLPVSHPYEKKTALRCAHLKAQERNRFVNLIQTAYQDFVAIMP